MTPVTDPELLAQLNGTSAQGASLPSPVPPPADGFGSPFHPVAPPYGMQPVTDPALLAQLNGTAPDPAVAAEPAAPSFGDQLTHQSILAGRNVAHGIMGLAGLVNDPIAGVLNKGQEVLGVDPKYRFGTASQATDAALNAIGVPDVKPANATERVVSDIERAMAGTGGMVGAGKFLARQAAPLLSSAGEFLQARAGAQFGSATGGAASAGLTRESGGGEAAQMAAGLAGGLSSMAKPVVAMTGRGLVRGGEVGRQTMERNIAAFSAAGVDPTLGQATKSPFLQGLEAMLGRTPGSSGVMSNAGTRQAEQAGKGIEEIANRLSPITDPAGAGRTIERGISGAGGFLDRFKQESAAMYAKLDALIPPDTQVPATNTQAMLARLTTPTPGMAKTSGQFIDNKLTSIRDALGEDLAANAAANGASAVPYQGLKELRSRIGEKLADIGFGVGDGSISRSNLQGLYGALSADMKEAAKLGGPGAMRAFKQANYYYKGGQGRIDALSRVVDKNGGPEAIFHAAVSGTKDGATTLRSVMQSLQPDEQKVLASVMVRKLGRATPGQQSAAGDAFSMSTYLTNWNRLSKPAQRTLFGRFGPEFQQDMDHLATMAENVRTGSKVLANPPGTAGAASQMAAWGGFASSLATGHVGVAAGIAGAAVTANIGARVMTNPRFVGWLAKQTKLGIPPQQANVANLIAMSKRDDDPDLRTVAELLLEYRSGSDGQADDNES